MPTQGTGAEGMTHRLLDSAVFLSVVAAAKIEELVGDTTVTLKLVLETLPQLSNQKDAMVAVSDETMSTEALGLGREEVLPLQLSHADAYQLLAELEDVLEALSQKQF
ncbi:hypothetical protein BCY84_17486 [Trypanosoma cruzi cruzi]|nr:hypothetical protein TcBrA4_0093030 [Trypanosoma cruzi]PBJ71148.1 hypothetical protein BCY84_17486 [Trypanosoma cruzi cruzi]